MANVAIELDFGTRPGRQKRDNDDVNAKQFLFSRHHAQNCTPQT